MSRDLDLGMGGRVAVLGCAERRRCKASALPLLLLLPFPVPLCSPLTPCTERGRDRQLERQGRRDQPTPASCWIMPGACVVPTKLLSSWLSCGKFGSFSFVPFLAECILPHASRGALSTFITRVLCSSSWVTSGWARDWTQGAGYGLDIPVPIACCCCQEQRKTRG